MTLLPSGLPEINALLLQEIEIGPVELRLPVPDEDQIMILFHKDKIYFVVCFVSYYLFVESVTSMHSDTTVLVLVGWMARSMVEICQYFEGRIAYH